MKPYSSAPNRGIPLAFLCAVALLIAVMATHPVVEAGVIDDFSYIRSAKTLAETGHIAYYGWSSAMLGAQLALGALFIKLFGFSFTIVRSSILLVSACTAALLQRTSVRLGLSEGNATFATLALVLSPLFIPLSFSFMTDITALLAVVVCLYFCLRAIQSATSTHTVLWLSLAAISSTILGTARQTGWLGVLVLVPCTFWIVRPRVRALPFVAGWLLCAAFILGCLLWFSHALYTTHEGAPHVGPTHNVRLEIAATALRTFLNLAFFLLPILVAFLLPLSRQRGRSRNLVALASLLFTLLLVLRPHSYIVSVLLAPSSGKGSYVTARGILDMPGIGIRPLVLSQPIRAALTLLIFTATISFFAFLFRSRRTSVPPSNNLISWHQIAVLLGPFTLASSLFLVFRIAADSLFDRYLLPLIAIAFILTVRFYQERVARPLPALSYIVVALYAWFAIAATHDFFSMERARLSAAERLRAAGIPRTSFYEGFGYDGWTQIDADGYVAAGGITLPPGAKPYDPTSEDFLPCDYRLAHYYPAIHASYALSNDKTSCGEPSRFAPVRYRMWLPPYSSAIYTQKLDPTNP